MLLWLNMSNCFVVKESGKVYAFGDNTWGQLGLGHCRPVRKPQRIKGKYACDFVTSTGIEWSSINYQSTVFWLCLSISNVSACSFIAYLIRLLGFCYFSQLNNQTASCFCKIEFNWIYFCFYYSCFVVKSKYVFVALSDKKIIKVACGRSHTLLATGYLFINELHSGRWTC